MTNNILGQIVIPILVGLVVEILSLLFTRWLDAKNDDKSNP